MRIVLIVSLALLHASAQADDRLTLQLTGGYTELNDVVPLDTVITPITISGEVQPPINARSAVEFDTEDETWEALLSYRLSPRVDLQAGYADLGAFTSESQAGRLQWGPPQPYRNPFDVVEFPFGLLDPQPDPPIFAGIALPFPASPATLDAAAWLVGLRVHAPVAEDTRAYARLGALRAAFDATSRTPNRTVADPDDETGWYWGAGVQYRLFSRLQVGLGYSQYDVDIARFDSHQLSLEFELL